MAKNVFFNFLKGILAGLAIGFGGFLFVLMTYLLPNELGKALGSLLFAIGLFTVCTFSLSLYTGKIGLIYEEKKDLTFYLSLVSMIIGNAIGAFSLGYICYFAFRNWDIYQTALNTANSRLVFETFHDYLSCMIKSFLCGTCVYLAVKFFGLNRLKPLGIFLLVVFVFIFVYSGYQHCIANMFYFGFANTINGNAFINLALCILFNSFGPIIGVMLFKLIKKSSANA